MSAVTNSFEVSGFPSLPLSGAQALATSASLERQQEFEEILARQVPKFRRIALRLLRNPEDAEDAVQDAMLSAFKHISRFDGRSQMTTWLTAIVINAVRMQIRRRPRGQMISIDHSMEDRRPTLAEILPDQKPTPEKVLEQRELRQLVHRLTAALPPKQQAALRLRQRDGLSVKQAADRLGLPEGTVKSHLTRGRIKLMQRFRAATAERKSKKAGRENQWNGLQSIPMSLSSQGGPDARIGA